MFTQYLTPASTTLHQLAVTMQLFQGLAGPRESVCLLLLNSYAG